MLLLPATAACLAQHRSRGDGDGDGTTTKGNGWTGTHMHWMSREKPGAGRSL